MYKYLPTAISLGALIFAYHHFTHNDESKVPQQITPLTREHMETEKATFAGGCFWCMVHPFDSLKGVHGVVSGYMGGSGSNPTYEDYAQKGQIEAIQITYTPKEVSCAELLNVLWHNMNPTDPDVDILPGNKFWGFFPVVSDFSPTTSYISSEEITSHCQAVVSLIGLEQAD